MQKCGVFANIDYEGVADAGLQELSRVLPSTSHPVTRLVATLDTVESFGKLNERWKLFKKEQVCCYIVFWEGFSGARFFGCVLGYAPCVMPRSTHGCRPFPMSTLRSDTVLIPAFRPLATSSSSTGTNRRRWRRGRTF